MTRRTLAEWLDHIEHSHPQQVVLGLERVARVRDRLGIRFSGPVIAIGGTNGKGSACAMLDAILRQAGYRVGLYTSPHLLRFNERVRIGGKPVDDDLLCQAFEMVAEAARGVPLTYFEYGTLAAWVVFAAVPLDVLVLEIGLGGRLDAVNAFEPDCSVITAIDLDHMEYLGGTRELIGAEKAGIFRSGKPAICADANPPASVIAHAVAIGADLQVAGRDFSWASGLKQWRYSGRGRTYEDLPWPALRGSVQLANASACLAALDSVRDRLPFGVEHVCGGLKSVKLSGRFEIIPGPPDVVLDVAHNPQAARVLAQNLRDMGSYAATHAVIGMLQDKDIAGVCREVKGSVSDWYVGSLAGPRGASAAVVARAIDSVVAGSAIFEYESPRLAYAAASNRASENDRIIVFGSFYTVADVMAARAEAGGSGKPS